MRRIVFSVFILCLAAASFAQDSSSPKRLLGPMQTRSKDHFVFQLGAATWQNRPDSIKTKGLSRTFNVYLMMDFPFKTSPKLSVALGPGFSTDHVFLNEMTAGIKDNVPRVIFKNVSDTNHFKKYKVATAFFEVPVELRYSSNPDADGKSFKAALGLKAGLLLAAWAKGKDLQNKADNSINDYILKEKSKRFFNKNRISAIGRIGYGHFSLFASYSLTSLFKEGVGPKMNAMSVGLTLSGL